MLGGVCVEHELGDRAVQARDLAFHHDEARAGEFRGGIEVEAAETGADVDVVLRLEAELARLAPAALLDRVLGPAADRDARVRKVGDERDELGQLLLHGGVLRFHLLQLLAELGALPHQRCRLRFVLLRLGLPDLPGEGIALGLQLLGGALDPPARLLERPEAGDVEGVATRRETFRDRVDIRSQQLDVDHFFFAATASRRRSSASFSRIAASSPRSVGTYQPGVSIPSGK